MGLITGVQLMKHMMPKKKKKRNRVLCEAYFAPTCHLDIDECQISPFELHC